MKKIAILTRRAGYNMGSSLQAYAMGRFISELGFPNQTIRYDEYSRFLAWRIRPAMENMLYFFISLCPPIFRLLTPKRYAYLKKRHDQTTRFEQFEQRYMNLTKKSYRSSKELARDFNSHDAVICGSDQIWNPLMPDENFMLGFIADHSKTKKVAYAPSLGVTDVKYISQESQNLIKRFDYLSCREAQGSAVIEQITGRSEVQTLIDPTLMLNRGVWEDMANEVETKPCEEYILVYFLQLGSNTVESPNEYLARLKERSGLPIYNVRMFNLINTIEADVQLDSLAPDDFLCYVKNASYICTNSFHCTIFSFIFQRKFVVFERNMTKSEGGGQNSRIHTLLNILEMESSLVKTTDEPNIEREYNFEVGIRNIETKRLLSVEYINQALK